MARKTFYLTRDQRHPLYRTRMLQAGPIELNASAARLYRKLGLELSDEAPRARVAEPAPTPAPKAPEPEPVAKKATPRPKPSTSSPRAGARKRKTAAKKR